jgi:signal transduction histidine kinase
MRVNLKKQIPLLLIAACTAQSAPITQESQETYTLNTLEQRLGEIDAKLSGLSNISLRSGVGSQGWISKMHNDGPTTEWAQINLAETNRIDQIVLTPVIWRNSEGRYQSDGFPRAFKLIAGTGDSDPGRVVAEFGPQDNLLQSTAPLVIPLKIPSASWIRIEAQTERSRGWGNRYCIQLSEIFIFDGPKNLALNKPVNVSSAVKIPVARAMYKEALVDGQTPYLMDAAEGEHSEPGIFFYRNKSYVLTIDLEKSLPLNEIILHTAILGGNAPRSHHADYGMPRHLRIEGANQSDFSDAVLLAESIRTTIYDTGPTVTLPFSETCCRYVRLISVDGYKAPEAPTNSKWFCIAFSEIEIVSNGKNIAVEKSFQDNGISRNIGLGRLEALTDGRNHLGNIIPLKTWLNELALRHELETERAPLITELNARYARQKANIRRLIWLTSLLTLSIGLFILLERFFHRRQINQIKIRFAADLHDELGANLHAIGLMSDAAEDAEDVEEWKRLTQRIRALTDRAGIAVQHCTNMLDAENLCKNLEAEMRHTANRIATNLKHDFIIEDGIQLEQLRPQTRADLFLFYKECIVNICRHSGATEFSTRLTADKNGICLIVNDNGQGVASAPPSLKRRARLLKAKLTVESPETGGTRITLRLKTKRTKPST